MVNTLPIKNERHAKQVGRIENGEWSNKNAYLRRSLLKQFATLNAVYGALGAVMALLLWIYFSGCVFTFGACLCAGQAEQEVEDTIVKIMKEAASGR